MWLVGEASGETALLLKPLNQQETTMETRSKLLLAALTLATLLPAGSIIMSTDAGAYPRWGSWPLRWHSQFRTQSVGANVIHSMYGNGKPCGLNMHLGSGGNCYIN